MPATLVVNESNNVVHFFGNFTDYVSIAPGRATFNLFHIINRDLGLAASTALSRCRSEQTSVTYTDIAVDTPSGKKVIDLMVCPVPDLHKDSSGLTAMLFRENRVPESAEGIREKYNIDTTAARRITDLEQELQESQNDLKKSSASWKQ